MHAAKDPFGLGIQAVAPRFGLPQEVNHLGVAAIAEMKPGGVNGGVFFLKKI